jgi:hypothetical protein
MTQIGISNTEVNSANACELAWGFGFHPEMHYTKRDASDARTRGIVGHAALETWYKGLRDGLAPDEAASEALAEIQALRTKEILAGEFVDHERLAMLNWLYDTLTKYFEYYEGDVKNWEILEVEAFHAQEQPGEVDFYLPSRLDLTIYQKTGKFKGETSPVDHKFTYNWWPDYKLDLNAQFPLYILALRAARFAGKPEPVVKRVIVNHIRTYPLSDPQPHDLFKRYFQAYSSVKLEKVFANHMQSAVRLAYLKRLPWPEALTEIRASLGSQACQYCDFKDLCSATFNGVDPSNAIAATLKKSDYGYPPLEEIRRERQSD